MCWIDSLSEYIWKGLYILSSFDLKVSETMDTNNINVSVLLSGGLDSSACIHYYLSQSFKVNAIFIDYGQKANENELNSAINIARHYGTKELTENNLLNNP
jgi:tRNA(Ile)-lysidine synthase TilS/MesJ